MLFFWVFLTIKSFLIFGFKWIRSLCFRFFKFWTKLRNFLLDVKCDVISVDEISEETKLFCKKKNIAIQGNLNPLTLLEGGQKLDNEVKNILERFKDNTHIFNLSHGILPKTPIENVHKVIDIVRKSHESTKKSS